MRLEIPVADAIALRAKLEAGHVVAWNEIDPRNNRQLWFMCQKRGAEYVTVCGTTESKCAANWKAAHDKGYYRDDEGRRVTIPGAR